MRKLVAIVLASVAFIGVAEAQKATPVVAKPDAAVKPDKDGLEATTMSCIITNEGQAIVVNKAPEGIKVKPVMQKPVPAFDPYKQKLLKYDDKVDGQRCVREPVLVELTDQEQKEFLKAQWNRWFGPAAALILDQQNQIRKLQGQPPINEEQLMDEVRKLPRK